MSLSVHMVGFASVQSRTNILERPFANSLRNQAFPHSVASHNRLHLYQDSFLPRESLRLILGQVLASGVLESAREFTESFEKCVATSTNYVYCLIPQNVRQCSMLLKPYFFR